MCVAYTHLGSLSVTLNEGPITEGACGSKQIICKITVKFDKPLEGSTQRSDYIYTLTRQK